MNNLKITLVQIPNNKDEDYNPKLTKWVNNRLVEFDEGKYINYYINHVDELGEEGKTNTNAYHIRVAKPVTAEKIITAVEKDVYNLSNETDYNNFQAKLIREMQENSNSSFIKDHTKLIRWVKNGINIAKGITTNEAKTMMLQQIEEFDASDSVNSFILNGIPAWLDKNTRVGLMNSIMIEKNSGLSETTLWLGIQNYTLPIDIVIDFLQKLELYAKQCYNKTAEHKYNISLLSNPIEILEYNYTEGYPKKLIYNL